MSPTKIKIFSLINFGILLISVSVIYNDIHNIWGWVMFYLFGTSMIIFLFFLSDKNPNKNKKHIKNLQSVSDDDGIFEYTETGFYIWDGTLVSKIDWYFVVRIVAAKSSDDDQDFIELLIETFDDRIVLNNTMHGWEKFVLAINRNLPIQNRNWANLLTDLPPQKPILIYHKNQYHY